MNLITASMNLKVDQARTKKIKLTRFTIREDPRRYFCHTNQLQLDTSVILIATIFFLYFSDPLLMEGLSHYIAPFGLS